MSGILRENSGNVNCGILSTGKRPLVNEETPREAKRLELNFEPVDSIHIANEFLQAPRTDDHFPFRGQPILEEQIIQQGSEYTGPIRHIFVQGGKGNEACEAAQGCCTVELHDYHQIKDLKKAIRKAFGVYKNHVLSTLQVRGQKGNFRPIKQNDLKDGVFIYCKYTPKSSSKSPQVEASTDIPLIHTAPDH
mmetsp:Transcript_1039/g.1294  ORF Transcript_1039/g.1294 Transcript_1039/m.1294 type:complete len:192 (+) Transcript_1039:106-681(+)